MQKILKATLFTILMATAFAVEADILSVGIAFLIVIADATVLTTIIFGGR